MKVTLHTFAVFAVVAMLHGCSGSDANRLPGYVEGEFVYVSAPISGKLQSLHVRRGAEVAQNALLFEIEDAPQQALRDAANARFAQAQAAVRDARKGQRPTEVDALQAQYQQAIAAQKLSEVELTRQQKLLSSAVGSSQQEVDRARTARDQANEQVTALAAQVKTAHLGARADQITAAQANADALQAQLTQAEWELGQTHQSASTAGSVTDTLYRPGEWVAAGHPVVVLLPPGNIKVRVYVPETKLSSLSLGGAVNVQVDGVDQKLSGRIDFISPKVEFAPPVIYSQAMRSKFVALVEVVFDPAVAVTLHPGQPVDVILSN
jgi:HlyD family secretion protein